MEDDPEEPSPPRRKQLSKTPSWVMLGFVVGALFTLALLRSEKTPASTPAPVSPVAAKVKSAPPPAPTPPTVERAQFFEDVFAELNRDAIWQDDRTEVAFWNATRKEFSDCYEVLRVGDKFYFRSIPRLTRPVLAKGMNPDSPLQFTVPLSAEQVKTSPTFDEMNHGIFSGANGLTPAVSAPKPERVPPVERPRVELPRVDGK